MLKFESTEMGVRVWCKNDLFFNINNHNLHIARLHVKNNTLKSLMILIILKAPIECTSDSDFIERINGYTSEIK